MDMDLDMCRVRCKVAGGVHPVLTPILAILALWKPVSCKGTSFTHSYSAPLTMVLHSVLHTVCLCSGLHTHYTPTTHHYTYV